MTAASSVKAVASLRERIEADGFLHIPNFFNGSDLEPIWEDIDELTSAFARRLNQKTEGCLSDQRDRPLVSIANAHPAIRPVMYDRLQAMPSLLAMPAHPKVRELSRAILGTRQIGVWPRVQLRFDTLSDDKNLIAWHHDYIYNKGTQHSYTFWMPLVSITPDMGLLQFAANSHHRADEVEFVKVENGRRFDYDLDEKTLKSFDVFSHDKYQAGDLVLFHSKFIHSGQLNSNPHRARLTALFRMQDLSKLEAFDA